MRDSLNPELPMALRDQGTWLESKVSRRELKEGVEKEGMDMAQRKAQGAAESYRDQLNRKAALRDDMRQKSSAARQKEEEILRQKADEYRKRLQSYLRPELRGD